MLLAQGKRRRPDLINREEAARAYVEYEIVAYLADRSDGCDTLEGITTWWLYRQRLADGPGMVRDAVRCLVAERRLVALERPGRETLYASRGTTPPDDRNSEDEE
jgi:hypothetical protein